MTQGTHRGHEIERELRDTPPRRFVRLTYRGRTRQAIIVTGLFAALCLGVNFSFGYVPSAHLHSLAGLPTPPAVYVIYVLLWVWGILYFTYRSAMHAVEQEKFLLQSGEVVKAVVTDRFGSVLNGADTFVIAYEYAIPASLGQGPLVGRWTVPPTEVQRYPVGAPLTLLVSPHYPGSHLPYPAFRYTCIEGAPERRPAW